MNTIILRFGLLLAMTLPVVAQTADSDAAKQARRETDVVRAVRAEKDAVVNISTTILMKSEDSDDPFQRFFGDIFGESRPRAAHSLGSGFIIHKDGYIITNAHVVQQANEVTVSFADKTTAKAQAVYADFEHDLAVIKIKPAKPLHALPLGRGDDLMIGETVIAIGNPMGYQHTVTVGVVSAIDRTLKFSNTQSYSDLIQTDAAINPGNSGGPLLNINGELIGINTAIRGDAQNLGFAINVQSLKRVLPELLSAEHLNHVNLGFKLSSSGASHIRVASLDENSPAARAGLQAGDIITGYDDKVISNPVDFYVGLLGHPVGRKLSITVLRDGRQVTVSMPFELKPKPNGLALARKRLGLVLTQVSAQRAQEMGLTDQPILVVDRVVSGSPAAEVRLRKGDILFQVENYRVSSLDELGKLLEPLRSGQTVTLGVARIRGNFISQATLQLKIQ